MKKHALYAAIVLGGTLALPSFAQNMKPGLWEITNKVDGNNGQLGAAMADMQKQMASMPPDQRKAMEQMMAKHGVQVGSNGAMRAKMCLTPEMARKNELMIQQEGDCTHNRSPAVGGKMKFSFACKNPRTSGEGEVAFSGDTSYQMKMRMVSGPKNESMTMDAAGKWLGADCGNIKPMAMPKQ